MTTVTTQSEMRLTWSHWFPIGLVTAIASVLAVLILQAIALFLWPELALFKPLDSYARSALFTLVPAVGATALLAWLVARRPRPVSAFLKMAAAVLIVSIIPDYLIPVAHKTLLASTVTALLHVTAATVTVLVLVAGYRRLAA